MTQEYSDDLLIARVLHYVIEKHGRLQCRAAIVVDDSDGNEKVNLAVFPDGSNDGKYGVDNHTHEISPRSNPVRTDIANVPLMTRWEPSVLPDHVTKTAGSWHWPRECSKLS